MIIESKVIKNVASVAPAPGLFPSQYKIIPNGKGDNKIKPGAIHRSPGI